MLKLVLVLSTAYFVAVCLAGAASSNGGSSSSAATAVASSVSNSGGSSSSASASSSASSSSHPCQACPPNEVYWNCPGSSCGPLTCAEAGYEKENCGISDPCPGGPGCICIDGYLRNSKGVCIPLERCPSCGGDKDKVSGCGNPCGKSCATYNRTDILCPAYCSLNGCDCRRGLLYDDNTKKCVKPENCSPICGENEEYTSCLEAVCRPQDCKNKGESWSCAAVVPEHCTEACICKKKYLRNKKGACVPEDKCEKPCYYK